MARAASQSAEVLLADVEKAELGLKLVTDFLQRCSQDGTWGHGARVVDVIMKPAVFGQLFLAPATQRYLPFVLFQLCTWSDTHAETLVSNLVQLLRSYHSADIGLNDY